MNLVIDIGNSFAKIALLENNKIIKILSYKSLKKDIITEILIKNPNINGAIYSSVRTENADIIELLKNTMAFINFNHQTKIPIKNLYKTKETLGLDRLASVIGANQIFPSEDILVIDAGTAITFDFINAQKEYYGGCISPGLNMRFKALNTFTEKLPLLSSQVDYKIYGNSTETSIVSGVQNGIIFEIDEYINRYKTQNKNLKTILTGGDTNFFVGKLKNSIFAEPNLVFIGLHKILKYNVENN